MNAVSCRKGALAVGLVLAMLLLAGCGTGQSTSSLDPFSSTQHMANTTLFENVFGEPSVVVLPQPAMSQIRLITFDRADRHVLFQVPAKTLSATHSQAQSQLATQMEHYCTH